MITPRVTEVEELKMSEFVPHTDADRDGITFMTIVPEGKKASLILYEKGSDRVQCEIPFPEKNMIGRLFAMRISGVDADQIEYNYRIGDKIVTDPSAQLVSGLEHYGSEVPRGDHQIRGAFIDKTFNWGENEVPLRIPYSESVFYELHVRGFTKSPSSKVKHKGTFLGAAGKIPYLKSLGVTAVVLMPCYEFDEAAPDPKRVGWRPEGLREMISGNALPEEALLQIRSKEEENANTQGASAVVNPEKKKDLPQRINYWGYGQGWLFAPKRSYCATKDPAWEFREMVRQFHEAGIEVIMQMVCTEGTDPVYMRAALLWWRQIYHVDGFCLMANQDDINSISKSAVFCDVKLITDFYDTGKMYPKGRPYQFRNLAEYNAGFRNDIRRYLKGDSGMLRGFVSRTRYNPKDAGVINAVTGHDGFTLLDLVSYNDKHNLANGEDNRDGAPAEFSWNCGVEGETRKRDILKLRMTQAKNALAMTVLAQGTPMITAGDEMCNSQKGNSNPYCFDSELTWVGWSNTKSAKELREFLQKLLAFRKEHGWMFRENEPTGKADGGFYPDFSLHGVNAWFPSFEQQDRSIGLMYCSQDPEDPRCVYVACNMHWEEKTLALPILPNPRRWKMVLSSAAEGFGGKKKTKEEDLSSEEGAKTITLQGRTIMVLEG